MDVGERRARVRVQRRRWSAETKRRLVAMSWEPGASVAAIALDHGLNANLLFNWRRQVGRGALIAPSSSSSSSTPAMSFVPIDVVVADERGPAVAGGAGRMEIELAGGTRVLVDGEVSQSALVRVLMALKAAT
jgi:transposase